MVKFVKNNLYLSLKGILGRKKENSILISMIIMSIIFLISFLIYNQSSVKSLDESRKNLYGEWYTATFNIDKPSINDDGISSVIRQNAFIYSDNIILGSIGQVDSNFKELSRIELLSGQLPSNKDEIALTTSLLDSIGCSYELGSIVTIPVLPIDFNKEQLNQHIFEPINFEYKLVGILPAYDLFWQKGDTPIVNAIVTGFPNDYPSTYQVLWKGANDLDSYNLIQGENTDVVVNEFAYPTKDNFDTSLVLIQSGVLALAFISSLVIYSLLLNRRRRSFITMSNLGATKLMITKLVFVESLLILSFSFLIGIPLGILIGILINTASKNLLLSIPWNQIVSLLFLLYFVNVSSFIISSILIRIDNPENLRNEKTKRIDNVSVASKINRSVILLTAVILFLTISALYLSRWTMMAYDRNVDYAAINIQSKDNQFFDENLLYDLKQIPEVQEVAAYNYVGMEYFVTNEEVRQNKVYNEIYDSTLDPMPVYFYKRGILRTNFFVLSEKESDILIQLSDMKQEDIQKFKNGEGVLYYQVRLEKNTETGMIYQFSIMEEQSKQGYEELELPIHQGSKLALSSNMFVNEEGHDYTKSNVFAEDIEVLGVLPSLNDKLLLGNSTPITNGSIFVSQNFYKKLMLRMEDRIVSNDEYTNVNVTIDRNASYSTRKSISSIVTSRGGLLQSDSYEIVDQLYRECSQKSLIIILSGSLLVIFCLILLWNIVSSSLLIEQKRIGILQALGISKKRLLQSYLRKIILVLLPLIFIVNGLAIGIMSIINQPKYLIQFTKIYVYGNNIYFIYPIGWQLVLNGIIIILYILIQIYPLYKLIMNEPIKNMKESGGI